MSALEDLGTWLQAQLDAAVAAGAASRQGEVDQAEGDAAAAAAALVTAQSADAATLAALQAAFDAYKATHPDVPAPAPSPSPAPVPPAPRTGFGFNVINGGSIYTQGAGETALASTGRLVKDYGTYDWAKFFNTGSFLPAAWRKTQEGATPATNVIVCTTWTPGSIANGSHDAVLLAYAKSVPAGVRSVLCWNEVDYKIPSSIDAASYVKDLDHAHDLLLAAGLASRVDAWDCWGEYDIVNDNIDASWVNAAKRGGAVIDCYWNLAGTDKAGTTAVAAMTKFVTAHGYAAWCVGETGDRRPTDANTPAGIPASTETTDASRAAKVAARLGALLAASPPPQGITLFDAVGTTGDHRILPGVDVATYAVVQQLIAAAR